MAEKKIDSPEMARLIKEKAKILQQIELGSERQSEYSKENKQASLKTEQKPQRDKSKNKSNKLEVSDKVEKSINIQDILLNPKNAEEQSLQQNILSLFSAEEIELLKQDITLTQDDLKQKIEQKQLQINPLQKIIAREHDALIDRAAHGEIRVEENTPNSEFEKTLDKFEKTLDKLIDEVLKEKSGKTQDDLDLSTEKTKDKTDKEAPS